MATDQFRALSGLTGRLRVKGARESLSAGLGPEISEIHDQIESCERKVAVFHAEIKTLTPEFETAVKGIANRITKKIEVNTEHSSQCEQQLEFQALQVQHAQETQPLQN
jgi:hypothetical protein